MPDERPPFRLRLAALYLVLAFAGYLVVAEILRALTPWPEDYGLKTKREYFLEHKDEYDMVILGSSVVYRSFVPEVIQAELARQGFPLKVFNLGNPAMVAFEANHLLGEILAAEPARLKWVILEPNTWNPEIMAPIAFTRRVVNWHSLEQTRLALISVLLKDAPLDERLTMAWDHVLHFGWRQCNYGNGPDIVWDLLGWNDEDGEGAAAPDLATSKGYRPLELEAGEEYDLRRKQLARNPDAYRERLKKLNRAVKREETLEGYNLDALRGQIEAVRAAGAEPIFVIGPGLRPLAEARALKAAGEIDTLMRYNEPARFPAFYAVKNRFDQNHLTRSAARRFSRRFARDLSAILAGKGDG